MTQHNLFHIITSRLYSYALMHQTYDTCNAKTERMNSMHIVIIWPSNRMQFFFYIFDKMKTTILNDKKRTIIMKNAYVVHTHTHFGGRKMCSTTFESYI